MSRAHARRFAAFVGVAAFVSFSTVRAQEKKADAGAAKIAEIQAFEGEVSIQGAAGPARTPTLVAKRVRGGSLYNGDTVSTQGGGSVEVLFLDGSKVTAPEKSRIQVREEKLARPTDKGQTVGRKIKILAGKVVGSVQPSKNVVTEFETPAGVAAVRGTTLEVGYDGRNRMSLVQRDGVTQFSDGDGLGDAMVRKGTSVLIESDGPGGRNPSWEVRAGKTTVLYEVPGTGRVECDMDAGDKITLDPDIGAKVDAGTVEVRTPEGDEISLSAGDSTAGDGSEDSSDGRGLSALEQAEQDRRKNPVAGGPYSGGGSVMDSGTYEDAMQNAGGMPDSGSGGGGGGGGGGGW